MDVPLPHEFVAEMVHVVAEVPQASWADVRPILEFLLKRRVLTNGMLRREGGILRLLVDRSDGVSLGLYSWFCDGLMETF